MRRDAITTGLALGLAGLVGSFLIWWIGASPIEVYGELLDKTWGSAYGIGQVLFKATPLILTGLAVTVAFKVGLFNIGAEGQLAAGSFVTALVGAAVPASLPGPLAVALCVIAGMVVGAALAALAGVLKARFGAHEVINTIMLNFIVSGVILWLGNSYAFVERATHTATISENAMLSGLGLPGSAANTSLVLALVLAAGVAVFFQRTRRGFEWRAVGSNPRAAENAGVQIAGVVIGAMAMSGALAGAVGANYVLGYKHYFERDIGSGVGVMGIAVALLGRNRPLGIIAAALLLATLSHGGLAVSELVPREIVDILQAIIILTVAGAAAYRGRPRKPRAAPAAANPSEGAHG